MLFYNNFYNVLIISYLYIFIYNISLFILFWNLQQYISFNFKTIYSFNDFKFNFFSLITMTIILFSLSGVPPFLGFFSKLLILISLINSNFFFFYIFFFCLLFFGLYFYVQNIKFLFSTEIKKINYSFQINMRLTSLYVYYTYFILFFILFGFFFIDDIFLYFYWLFS